MTPFQTSFPHALQVRDEIAVGDVVLRLKGTHCGCRGCPCNESERYEGVLVKLVLFAKWKGAQRLGVPKKYL